MNTDLTEKLEQLEAYLGIDYYGDANYVMELLKEAKNLAINYTRCCETLNKERPKTTSTLYPIKEKKCFWCGNKR
jgi:hypothetical protein